MLSEHVALGFVYDWLFAEAEDVPPHQNTVSHRWRTTLERAGVKGVRLHDLRHFNASGLIAAGCDVVAVQRALGHAKSTTTLTTYAHLWPSAEDRVRNAAAHLFTEVVGSGEGTVRAEHPWMPRKPALTCANDDASNVEPELHLVPARMSILHHGSFPTRGATPPVASHDAECSAADDRLSTHYQGTCHPYVVANGAPNVN